LRHKCLIGLGKKHPALTNFTFCLPGSPKVNAGGAYGVLAAGA
jgi:hypothetical protein